MGSPRCRSFDALLSNLRSESNRFTLVNFDKTNKPCNNQSMKPTDTKRPVKTAGYSFVKQAARRAKRCSQAQIRQASPSEVARGLRERIANAPTIESVKALFSQGKSFQYVSAKTYRAWERAAQVRISRLGCNQ